LTDGGLIPLGKIVNTHGVRGEVKLLPATDTPDFVLRFRRVFAGAREYSVLGARVHGGAVLLRLEGVDDFETATALRGLELSAPETDAGLEPGVYFVRDIIGLRAVDDDTGEALGVVADRFELPPHGVYVVAGAREILIPAVPEFVRKIDVEAGEVRFHIIEGL
jgi:16S rRNA processing protein RimM